MKAFVRHTDAKLVLHALRFWKRVSVSSQWRN